MPHPSSSLPRIGAKFQVPEAREDGCHERAMDHGVRLPACGQHQGQRVGKQLQGSTGRWPALLFCSNRAGWHTVFIYFALAPIILCLCDVPLPPVLYFLVDQLSMLCPLIHGLSRVQFIRSSIYCRCFHHQPCFVCDDMPYVSQGSMSPAQRDAYEDNKLKMRKAMADPELVDEMDQVI